MVLPNIRLELKIPEGVELSIDGDLYKIKGPKGETERKFASKRVKIQKENGSIVLTSIKPAKKQKMEAETFKAHFKNMIKGVQELFVYKLRVCSGHFPISVSYDNNEFVVKNFFGEKVPRKVKLPKNIKLKIEGDLITIESPDIEAAGLAASSIELLTRRIGFDPRIFQDGIYIIEKGGEPIVK